jgi:hypothetical protein
MKVPPLKIVLSGFGSQSAVSEETESVASLTDSSSVKTANDSKCFQGSGKFRAANLP